MAGIITPAQSPYPRSALGYDGTNYYTIKVDADGHIQVDVLNMITDLSDLLHALKSVNTDQIQVRGQDQLHSYHVALFDLSSGVPSGANGYRYSTAVPAGEIWHVTLVSAYDSTKALTQIGMHINRGGTLYTIKNEIRAFAINDRSIFQGDIWLEAGDKLQIYFVGSAATDTCAIHTLGEIMSKES